MLLIIELDHKCDVFLSYFWANLVQNLKNILAADMNEGSKMSRRSTYTAVPK